MRTEWSRLATCGFVAYCLYALGGLLATAGIPSASRLVAAAGLCLLSAFLIVERVSQVGRLLLITGTIIAYSLLRFAYSTVRPLAGIDSAVSPGVISHLDAVIIVLFCAYFGLFFGTDSDIEQGQPAPRKSG